MAMLYSLVEDGPESSLVAGIAGTVGAFGAGVVVAGVFIVNNGQGVGIERRQRNDLIGAGRGLAAWICRLCCIPASAGHQNDRWIRKDG